MDGLLEEGLSLHEPRITFLPVSPRGNFYVTVTVTSTKKDFYEVYRERKGFVPVCNTAVVTRERERKSRIERD